MRIIRRAIIFVLLSGSLFGESISIATFNIRIFSNNSRDDTELLQICDLLKDYDFIALQEVRDTKVLDRTIAMLRGSFGLDYANTSHPARLAVESKRSMPFCTVRTKSP